MIPPTQMVTKLAREACLGDRAAMEKIKEIAAMPPTLNAEFEAVRIARRVLDGTYDAVKAHSPWNPKTKKQRRKR